MQNTRIIPNLLKRDERLVGSRVNNLDLNIIEKIKLFTNVNLLSHFN